MSTPTLPEAVPVTEPVLLTDRETWRLRINLAELFRQNAGLTLTLGYMAASVIGLAYNFLFFRRFGINALEFSETADFLMVVVREPLTIALALSGVLVYLVYGTLVLRATAWVHGRWPKLKPTLEKRRKSQRLADKTALGTQIVFIAVYAFLFILLYSKRQARLVREGEGHWVTVEYKTDAPASMSGAPVRAKFLGTTSRFVFLFRPDKKEADAVPLDAVARLVWDARSTRERAADEAKKIEQLPGR